MLNHTLQVLEVSAWPDDLRQALERGLFWRLELDAFEDIPNMGDIKEKYVPYIRRLREPVEPGGVAGGDARSGDTGPPQKCHWPREVLGCFLFLGSSFTLVSPPAAPRTGRIGHCLEKVAAADPGLPEVPLGVLGNPPSGWSSPLRGSFGDFRGGLLGPVGLHVACLPHLHSASGGVGTCLQFAALGSRSFDRRLEPLFSAWLGSLHSFCCARLTLVFGTAFQGSCGTRWRMSLSPRDRRTGSCWCLRHGTAEEGRQLGGEPAMRFVQLLELSGIPVGQADQVVPTDYFNGLAASAAGRLPQPLSAGDLADLWDSLWLLLMAAADGKLSENFSPLENEWDRQDQLRWFSRDDPPPLQPPELLKWRHWRPGKIREMEPTTQRALELHMWGNGQNGSLPTSPPLRSTLHTCRTSWGRTSARKHWTSWGTAGSGHSGNTAWSTRVSAREASPSSHGRNDMSVLSSTSSPMRRSPRASCGRCGTPSSGSPRPSDC